MNIGVITTSRADFGIYLPLLKALQSDDEMEVSIFAGGMHLLKKFGHTYKMIEDEGFQIAAKVNSLDEDDSAEEISKAMGRTTIAFGEVWKNVDPRPDMVFVLGDRFEMFAAVASLLPFGIPIAHLHGGESSFGALDHKFRNAITSMADFHFASTEEHAGRVADIIGTKKGVFNVGALGLEGIRQFSPPDRSEFERKYGLQPGEEFILTTFHPETMYSDNEHKAKELISALRKIPLKVICTLPNADQQGNLVRTQLLEFQKETNDRKIVCHENLGLQGYYSAMHFCKLMIGNSSSGIIEAASFNKIAINVGDRQLGRASGKNVMHVACEATAIYSAYLDAMRAAPSTFINTYGDGHASEKIITALKREIKLKST